MGGVSILLFGIIAASGLRMLVESQVDFASNRNLVIASVVLVVGIGNLLINLKGIGINLQIEGMALSALSGIILNLILPKIKPNKLSFISIGGALWNTYYQWSIYLIQKFMI